MMQLARNQALEALERDIDSIILGVNMTPYPAINKDNLMTIQVVEYNQGYALLSVSLPEPMVKGYVAFLEGYHELWKGAQYNVKSAKAEKKAVDPVEIEKRELRESEYKKAVVSIFDGLIASGTAVREIIKETSAALKQRFAWSDYSTVFTVLSQSGRLKDTGYYKKEKVKG